MPSTNNDIPMTRLVLCERQQRHVEPVRRGRGGREGKEMRREKLNPKSNEFGVVLKPRGGHSVVSKKT